MTMADCPARAILILGGTAESRGLAAQLAERGDLRVITSLAGRTNVPSKPAGELRIGGFGGVAGLANYLEAEGIAAVIDATHPFATTMSGNAVESCRQMSIPLARLHRPAWTPQIGDDWTNVEDEAAACAAVPAGASTFLALGSQYLAAFTAREDLSCVVRMVDPPGTRPPKNWLVMTGKPSASAEDEAALFSEHGISHLVCRNSGGTAGYAKIAAARELGLPVIMIERPEMSGGQAHETIDEVLAWLDEMFGS